MKIVLIIPTLKQGGAERVISELANYYSNINIEVHLVLLAKGETNKDITIHQLNFENKNIVNKIINEIKVFFKLRKLLKTINPKFYDKIQLLQVSILMYQFLYQIDVTQKRSFHLNYLY